MEFIIGGIYTLFVLLTGIAIGRITNISTKEVE